MKHTFLNIYVLTEWVFAVNAKIYLLVNQHAKYVPHTCTHKMCMSGFGFETYKTPKICLALDQRDRKREQKYTAQIDIRMT